MQREMRVQGLLIDPITNMPIVVLRDPRTDAKLPIWVGVFEANAIAVELEKIRTPRPMTHDLLREALRQLGAKLVRVAVVDLQDNTFYAALELETPFGPKTLDARPSDAIALALRCQAPILVDERVVEAAQRIDLTQGRQDAERFRAWLESLDEGQFGKYEI
ncbi:MAG TPA: bifunctional nuclease family protein [Acidobacteriota bacterium]|nr:bifunctional nuclease family protein [bacterium]HNX20111.1 bifunctional nuclease family protein [Acidobacteriota bacterium]